MSDSKSTTTCHRVALSDVCGYFRLNIDPINPGASHLSPDSGEAIMATTIDSYEFPVCDKLDIEGCELLALRGAEKTIARCRPVLVLEVCSGHMQRLNGSKPEQVHDLLREWNYNVEALSGEIGTGQYDIIAKPQ